MVHRIQLIVTFGIVQDELGTGQMVMVPVNISDRRVSIYLFMIKSIPKNVVMFMFIIFILVPVVNSIKKTIDHHYYSLCYKTYVVLAFLDILYILVHSKILTYNLQRREYNALHLVNELDHMIPPLNSTKGLKNK